MREKNLSENLLLIRNPMTGEGQRERYARGREIQFLVRCGLVRQGERRET